MKKHQAEGMASAWDRSVISQSIPHGQIAEWPFFAVSLALFAHLSFSSRPLSSLSISVHWGKEAEKMMDAWKKASVPCDLYQSKKEVLYFQKPEKVQEQTCYCSKLFRKKNLLSVKPDPSLPCDHSRWETLCIMSEEGSARSNERRREKERRSGTSRGLDTP